MDDLGMENHSLIAMKNIHRPGHEEESDLGGRHDHEDHGEGRSQDAGLAPGMKSIGKP